MEVAITLKGTTGLTITECKKLAMINALVRDMAERNKGYDKSDEFPQTTWHFVVFFQDWTLNPRNTWVYGVTKIKFLISIETHFGFPKHTHSKHTVCVTIFSYKHLEKWERRHSGDTKEGLIRANSFSDLSLEDHLPRAPAAGFYPDDSIFPVSLCPARTTTRLCLQRFPGTVGPIPRSICLLTLQERALLEILLLF